MGFFSRKKKAVSPDGNGQGGGAPKTLRVHFRRSGSFWIDRDEMLNDPDIQRKFREIQDLVVDEPAKRSGE